MRTEITKSHLNNHICQHRGMKTSTVTPSFYYVFNISLYCYDTIPNFIGNLWRVLLPGNHLKLYLELSHHGACSHSGQASRVVPVGDSMHDKKIYRPIKVMSLSIPNQRRSSLDDTSPFSKRFGLRNRKRKCLLFALN